jgi:hypothetical protein
MSTVLPLAAALLLDELPPALVLLLLLLQPTTARAIAAKAAIAGVRLIYLPLVDVKCPAATEHTDRPVWAS